jgi:hypothetical protein
VTRGQPAPPYLVVRIGRSVLMVVRRSGLPRRTPGARGLHSSTSQLISAQPQPILVTEATATAHLSDQPEPSCDSNAQIKLTKRAGDTPTSSGVQLTKGAYVELESGRVQAPAWHGSPDRPSTSSPSWVWRPAAASPAHPRSRGLHSSTFQLNVSAFHGLHVSSFRLDVSTFCGLCWEISWAKTFRVEPRSGRLPWFL